MEIMKIFSDTEGNERLFSVLMTEDEVALFSEMKEEEEKKGMSKGAKAALGVSGATAATGAGIYGAGKLGKNLINRGQKVLDTAGSKIGSDYAKDWARGERLQNIGEKLRKPASYISKKTAGLVKKRALKK